MNINELPDFLNRYNKARAKKSDHFIYFTVAVDVSYPEPFFLNYLNMCGDEKTEHIAPTFPALLEKMKKDIDETP